MYYPIELYDLRFKIKIIIAFNHKYIHIIIIHNYMLYITIIIARSIYVYPTIININKTKTQHAWSIAWQVPTNETDPWK